MRKMSFEAFDTRKLDEYARQAKASWGSTDAYKEYEKKSAGQNKEEQYYLNSKMMEIFLEFGKIKDQSPESNAAVELAKRLQDFITEHFYTCTDKILLGLGAMYSGGGGIKGQIYSCRHQPILIKQEGLERRCLRIRRFRLTVKKK